MEYVVEADPATLKNDLRRLFENTTTFNDSWKVFAAAASAHAEAGIPYAWSQHVDDGPVEALQVLREMVQGKEVELADESHFFSVFQLSRQLKIAPCSEACQDAVGKLDQPKPIRLQLSIDQNSYIRQKLREWVKLETVPFADATVKVRVRKNKAIGDDSSDDQEDAAEWKEIRVHAVVLAASCEFFRGLWAGTFSEACGLQEVRVEDPAEAEAAATLIDIVYGGTAKIQTYTEVLELYRLADKWQCDSVLSRALEILEADMDDTMALHLLEASPPLPAALQKVVAMNLADVLSGPWETVSCVVFGRNHRYITERDPPMKMSLTAAIRMLHLFQNNEGMLSLSSSELMQRIEVRKDNVLESVEWLKVSAEVMVLLMSGVPWLLQDPSYLSKWALQGDADIGQAITRITELSSGGSLHELRFVLSTAITHCKPSPRIMCSLLSAAFGQGARDVQVPLAKRPKTNDEVLSNVLATFDSFERAVLGRVVLEVAGETLDQVSSCQEWLRLSPSAVLKVVRASLIHKMVFEEDEGAKKRSPECSLEPLRLWALAAPVPALFEALDSAMDCGECSGAIKRILNDVAQHRMKTAEDRNSMRLDDVVAAAEAAKESSVRNEMNGVIQELRRQLEDEKRLREEECVARKSNFRKLQENVLASIAAEMNSFASA